MPKTLFVALTLGATICAPDISQAETVDFLGGSLVSLEMVPGEFPGQTATGGIWRENGIDVDWRSYNDLVNDYGTDPADIAPPLFTNLSESNPGADPFVTQEMVITRTGGGAFDLDRIGSSYTYEGFLWIGEFIPEGASTSTETVEIPLLGPSLTLTGVKTNSATVVFEGTTKSSANFSIESGSGFSAVDVILPADVKALFTDLASLTLEVAESQGSSALESFTELGAPDIFVQALAQCGEFDGDADCAVPGLGDFYFTQVIGDRNDFRNVTISEIDLSFSDTPAPVPLPASALLLMAGLGALSVASRKRL